MTRHADPDDEARPRSSREEPTLDWRDAPTLPSPSAPSETAGATLEPGRTFGEYRVRRPLGRGGFGEVWEAEHLDTGRRVALKVLSGAGLSSAEGRRRFRREALIAASMSHPACVFVFGATEDEGRLGLAMELMEGGTLQDRLDREGRLPISAAVDLVLALVDGLEAAHEKGILHRDIKPSNCFLDRRGRVKIGDFGLSKSTEGQDEGLTATGAFLGTPAYSSPEQVRGRRLDVRSDIFSLGALLFHLASGVRPFGGGQVGEVLARILGEEPPPLATRGVRAPRGFERALRRMMSKEPGRRYQDYSQLRRALLPYSSVALGPAALGKRFAAYFLDTILLGGLGLGYTYALDRLPLNGPAPVIFDSLVSFGYFAALEGRWGTTAGKRLLGLRVRAADGGAAGWRRVLARTGVYFAAMIAPTIIGGLFGGVTFGDWLPLVALVGALVVVSTMRTRNGYAAVHDLVSGTRVVEAAPRPAPRARLAPAAAAPQGSNDERYGPYEVLGQWWASESRTLLLARDPLLDRPAWILVGPGDGEPGGEPAVEDGPESVRWLQAGRASDGRRWNAYEALDGVPLLDWIEPNERLGWGRARSIVRDLASRLEERAARDAPIPSPSQLWVEPDGTVRVLPFPWRDADPTADAGSTPINLARRVAIALLEGRLPRPSELDEHRVPRRPMPARVRRLFERLARSEIASNAEFLDELTVVDHGPAEVNRFQRAAALAVSGPVALSLNVIVLFDAALGVASVARLNPASVLIAVSTILALLLAFALRGGLGFAVVGIRVQGRDGRPAERSRCLMRAAFAWLPMPLLAFTLFLVPAEAPPQVSWILFALLLGLFIAGGIRAVIRPEQGWQDRLAGTRLVPR